MTRYLITSALPYINGMKHLGNLVGSMLPADVFARFRRMQGHETLFICGTDEHGTPAEIAASEAGMEVRAYCDVEHLRQTEVYKAFSLSFDYFGRTSNLSCHKLTQALGERLEFKGLIEERTTPQIYSMDDHRFLPDRYVEGQCPICYAPNARGDQCDECGSLLDPTDLINPRSKLSGSGRIELRETRHLFLLQSKMADIVRRWINSREHWPILTRSIANKWLDEGLRDRSITRDLSWGVPVTKNGQTRPGFDEKVYYVWFDAPIGYISATVDWAEGAGTEWTTWWKTDRGTEPVTLVQFMGKDNVAFHTTSFPITLLGADESWKLVDQLKAFNWLNWYGSKFSTSRRCGLFLDQALELFPADVWRWYLIANAPESSDASFRWDHFQTTVNSDLANVIGNAVNRIIAFATSKFHGKFPAGGADGPLEIEMRRDFVDAALALTREYEALEYRKMTAATRALWVKCNTYFQSAAPWAEKTANSEEAARSVAFALAMIRDAALMSMPIVPNTCETILNALGVQERIWPPNASSILRPVPPKIVGALPILFARIDNTKLAELESLYPAR